jgi:hypothetical protein
LVALAVILVLAVAAACRQGMPVIDTTPGPEVADGTISGTVRGPDRSPAIVGRTVEVVNLETGARQKTTTNEAGGFSFKVAPGRYRVVLALMDGEVIVKQPPILQVNRSDVDAFADFVLGASGAHRQRFPRLRGDHGLGAPSA